MTCASLRCGISTPRVRANCLERTTGRRVTSSLCCVMRRGGDAIASRSLGGIMPRPTVHVCATTSMSWTWDAHILALRHLDVHPNGKFNLGAGRAVSNLELLRTVEQVSGARIEFEFGPRRAGDPAVLVASPRRAVERLGWSPRHSALDTIVESALHWRGRHPDGYGSGSGSVVERAGAV